MCPGHEKEQLRLHWKEVGTHLASADHISGGGQHVDHLALALVTPLRAQHDVHAGTRGILATRVKLVVGNRAQVHGPT